MGIQKVIIRTLTLSVAAAVVVSIASPLAAMAATSGVPQTDTNNEVRQALQNVPGILEGSDQTITSYDGDSAIVSTRTDGAVDVPKNPEQGVTFGTTSGPKLAIKLPNADTADAAEPVAQGVVAYDANNGSTNAVQTNEDGSVRMLTIIDNPNAPTAYDYQVTIPNGGRIELSPDGGAVILESDDTPMATVAVPWAKDAKEKSIKTWFTTDGTTLTQYVKHDVKGVEYPVVADPQLGFGWYIYLKLSPQDQTFLIQAGPTAAGAAVCMWITKQPKIAAACGGLGGIVNNWINIYYKARCWVEIKFLYTAIPVPVGIKKLC